MKKEEGLANKIYELYNRHPLNGTPHDDRAYWLAFYNGDHYIKNYGTQSQINADRYDGLKHKSKFNQIKPNCHISVSAFLKDLPIVTAIPTGNCEDDKKSARAATRLAKYCFDQHQRSLIQKLYEVMTLAYIHGTGYWYVYWDPNLYANVKIKSDGKTKKEPMKKGDWNVKVCDDFSVYPDPTAKEHGDLKWVILRDKIHIEDAMRLYKLKDKPPEIATDDVDEKRYLYSLNHYSNQVMSNKDHCSRIQYWSRPSEDHPKGRYIVVLADKILALEEENEYCTYGDFYAIPIIPFWWDKGAMEFHGNSVVRDQIPIQKEINLCASLIMMNARMTASTSLAIPKGSGIKKSDWDGTSNVFEYNPIQGARPEILGGNSIAPFVPAHLGTLMGMIQDISGTHEVSMGQIPERGSRMPASALKMLMDSEAVRHAPSMRMMQLSLIHSVNLILKMIQEKYSEERYINILGDGYKYETDAFIGADLDGSWDLILQVTSGISASPSTKLESLLSMWDRQIPQAAKQGDPAALEVMRMLEFGDTESYMRKDQIDISRVDWWFKKLKDDREVPDLYSFDNHDLFLDKLQTYAKSAEYQDEDQKTKDAIMNAITVLEQEKANASQGQGQSQAGQPPPAPGGEPPMQPMDMAQALGSGGEEGAATSSMGMPNA